MIATECPSTTVPSRSSPSKFCRLRLLFVEASWRGFALDYDMQIAERYRELAKGLLVLAARHPLPETSLRLSEVARDYERLADRMDLKARAPQRFSA